MEYKMKKKCCGLAVLTVVVLLAGCESYYKAATTVPVAGHPVAHKVDSLNAAQRYFVLRSGNDAYYMRNVTLSEDQQSLECKLDTLPVEHTLHLHNGRNKKRRYNKNKTDVAVLSEVHLYIPRDSTATLGRYTLPLERVQKIEVIQKDRKRTTNSYVIGAIGYTLGAAVIVTIIYFATKSSCPFVSGYDGHQFTLQGEIYGGAIYPQLARHDYMPLALAPLSDERLQLKISNELLERQYTDIANLMVITHDSADKILADEKGHLYSVTAPQSPVLALLNHKKDVTAALKNNHDNALLYMDDSSFAGGSNQVTMQFNKPVAAGKAKLVLSLKNSYWLDYLYGELAKGFGRYYPMYIKQQRNKPATELLKWVKEQQIPLEVSVKTSSGWKRVAELTTIGPLATREVVVPIDLNEITGTSFEVRLSSGFMFWELDYAGIDYSEGTAYDMQELSPAKAVDEQGKNILSLLQSEDNIYLEQPEIGNTATLTYNHVLPHDPSKRQTFILHTRGYYEHIRHFKGGANKAFLQSFKKPGAFTAFSLQHFRQFKKEALGTLAKNNSSQPIEGEY